MSTTPGSLRPTRDPPLAPYTHPLTHRRKQRSSLGSRHRRHGVRKSLKFGDECDSSSSEPKKRVGNNLNIQIQNEAAQNSFLEATSHFPKYFNPAEECRGRPPVPNFWNSPPHLPSSPPTEGDRKIVHRRSMRLRAKSQFPVAQITDTSPGLLNEPTSDLLLRSKTYTVGGLSQPSDYGYGTSSETSNSLYFRPSANSSFSVSSAVSSHCQDLLPRFNKVKTKAIQDSAPSSQSVGYVSDLDDSLSNLSIDDATENDKLQKEPKHWDSNENINENSEWEDCPKDTGDHLRLKDLHLKNVKVHFRTQQGVSVVMPLDGHKIVRTPTRFGAAPVPINNRYHLRKRPIPAGFIEIELLDNSNIEEHLLLEGLRVFQVSPIISIKPYEVEFVPLLPALIQIPLVTEPAPGDEVHCLYCKSPMKDSGTNFEKIPWKSVEAGKFSINNRTVYFEAFHFGVFVLVIRPKCPFSSRIKEIRTRVGGKLTIRDFPSIEVAFPKEATDDIMINAEAKVYLDTEESISEFLAKRAEKLQNSNSSAMEVDNWDEKSYLATPILQLEPHGINFKNEPVLVTLPVPDYDEIMKATNNTAKLVIFQSSTQQHETARWERLDVKYEITKVKIKGELVTLVTFPVAHFSFFKGIWEAISNCMDKIGMLYYFVSFAMKCQANMEEYCGETSNTATNSKTDVDGNEQQPEQFGGGSRFGLEVSVFQADKNWPQMATYKYKVGQSNSKMVKPGKILIRLKSLYFEPDVQAGEDEEMMKEEADFRGRDFEKQFICKFKPDVKIDRGPFGKVVITRFISSKVSQPLFEFNLQKHGNEADVTSAENQTDQWSSVALKELANNLFLTDGDNWKEFAKEVGMTKQEVKDANVKHDKDPFQKIVNHYRNRGGTAQELVDLMYRCHRSIRNNGNFSPQSSHLTRSSNGSSGRGSLSSNNANFNPYGSHDSDTSGQTTETRTSQDSGLPPGRKRSHQLSNRGSAGSLVSNKKPKRKRPSENLAGPSRRVDIYEESDSDADEEDSDNDRVPASIVGRSVVSADEENRKKDKTILNTQFLWSISDYINISSWRALGRTLGLDEAVLIEVDHGYGKTSFRECAYQMLLAWKSRLPKKCTFGNLYNALNKEGMASAAKKMTELDLLPDNTR